MIFGVTGKIGGGKTAFCVTMMLDHFAKGGCVATNIGLNTDKVREVLGSRGYRFQKAQYVQLELEAADKRNFFLQLPKGTRELPVLVFIDEAHLFFSASQYRALASKYEQVKSALTQSRRLNVDVYFITQVWGTLWSTLREQAEFYYRCRNFKSIQLGPVLGDMLSQFGILGLNWKKVDSMSGEVLGKGRTKFDMRVFSCYDDHQALDSHIQALMDGCPQFELPEPARFTFKEKLTNFGRKLIGRPPIY